MAEERKREIVLPPNTYAFVLDGTKGQVRLHVGPLVVNQTNQDTPVVYDPKGHTYVPCTLEQAVRQSVVVPEGFYAVLTNPAKDKTGKNEYPTPGRLQESPDLLIGQKENVPGPVDFALYPGQTAELRRGHHLRFNEYLRIKVYNAEKAKLNWAKAVVETVEGSEVKGITGRAPSDIAVGKQYNILGTEVSFYIPPTGISVVTEGWEDDKPIFVRGAETLEQLEYAILVDEDGNKEYPRGPAVVFPKPTQKFLTDSKGNRKFRAVEMNELQGIQLKFITDGELELVDGTKVKYTAGEERFITGKEMPIYYPEEGHQLVKYDGKTIHYAVAIPEGEARYVMNRKSGEIRTVKGPTMLLPNPVTEIIVRRALSDHESATWFPGSEGTGSKESLEYNRWLRTEATKESTTRQGVVSEGRLEKQEAIESALYMSTDVNDGGPSTPRAGSMYKGVSGGDPNIRARSRLLSEDGSSRVKSSMMSESRQGKPQEAMVGDVQERKSTYNEPRTITFANKFKGVPTIRIAPGYAVSIAKVDGSRSVIVGPKTAFLEYGETLDALALSMGKPKTTDRLWKTAYLNVKNNTVSDIVRVETSDHVLVQIRLGYQVNFEGDSSKWFTIENYVKHLCDHVRSVLKGALRGYSVEAFYQNSTEVIRSIILGEKTENQPRPGMVFQSNGMKVFDVEVLGVEIADQSINELLSSAQREMVETSVNLLRSQRNLEFVTKTEEISRQEAITKAETLRVSAEIQSQGMANQHKLTLQKIGNEIEAQVKNTEVVKEKQTTKDTEMAGELRREKEAKEMAIQIQTALQSLNIKGLEAESAALVQKMASIQPGLIEGLLVLSRNEVVAKMAEASSPQVLFGGKNVVDVLQQVFGALPSVKKALESLGVQQPGNGPKPALPPQSRT
jgi:major vault protein